MRRISHEVEALNVGLARFVLLGRKHEKDRLLERSRPQAAGYRIYAQPRTWMV